MSQARPEAPRYTTALLKKLGHTNLDLIRFYMLGLALALYAIAGSPTPDNPGITELAIALLLITAIPLAFFKDITAGSEHPWQNCAKAALIYGVNIPLIIAGLQGHSITLIARDLIPFAFLFLPLLYAPLINTPARATWLLRLCLLIGLCFSIRALAASITQIMNLSVLQSLSADPLSYLANAPTVLFTALFLTGYAGRIITEKTSWSKTARALGVLALTLLPLAAMAAVLQRASLGTYALSCVYWLGLAIYYRPRASLRLLLPLAIITLASWPLLSGTLAQLAQKTAQVGANMRIEELNAVWQEITKNPLTLLFGLGWGGTFASPAVGGLTVNFTHSLASSILLKAGLCGFLLTMAYMTYLGKILLSYTKQAPILTLALAGPFLIDIFLYASFKSLDFGLILLLIGTIKIHALKESLT